jgi:peptidoglycan/LPS O-acetylase OafA/YrhL
MSTSNPTRLEALSAIRFFAAFSIALYHFGCFNGLCWAPHQVRYLASLGYVAVTFFFVLSGFVLVYRYAKTGLNLQQFWRRRLVRIYPLYLFSLMLSAQIFFGRVANLGNEVPFLTWFSQHLGSTVVLVLSMCQAWVPLAALAWNGPAWFISDLIFFLAIFPMLLSRFKSLSVQSLFIISLSAWLLAQSAAITYELVLPDGVVADGGNDTLLWLNVIKFNPIIRLPEFLIGMACGFWFIRKRERQQLASPLVLFGILLIIATIAASHSIPYVILHTGFLAPAFAAIICGLALRPTWASPLEWRAFVLLGDSSYAIYLLHVPIFLLLLLKDFQFPVTITPIHAISVFMTALVGGVLAFQFVEKPSMRWLQGRSAPPELSK